MFINLYTSIYTLCANKMADIKLNYAECVNNEFTLLCIYLIFNPHYWHPIVVSQNKRKIPTFMNLE